jgi:chemotaxis signal transduction protein
MDAASQRTLEQRARDLARVPTADEAEAHVELLVFRMGGERFALETTSLVEVFRARELARLPSSEAPFFGVTVWRGDLLLLLDLRALLSLPMSAEDQLTHVVVLKTDRSALGLLMELEREIVSVAALDVMPAAGTNTYVRAVTRSGLQILDPSALLRL